MLYPVELQYSKSHEWVKVEDGVTVVGISDFCLLYTSDAADD